MAYQDPKKLFMNMLNNSNINQSEDRSYEASIDKLVNLVAGNKEQKKSESQGRQRTMSAIAGNINTIYNNE